LLETEPCVAEPGGRRGPTGAGGALSGATEAGPPPGALQFLKHGAGFARPPGQGGKTQGHGEGGEGIAEQLGQQEEERPRPWPHTCWPWRRCKPLRAFSTT
jgi:hypothetical protein